jgi:hypothetical protein
MELALAEERERERERDRERERKVSYSQPIGSKKSKYLFKNLNSLSKTVTAAKGKTLERADRSASPSTDTSS